MFLGIEIGGTKLQLGLGEGDGHLLELWRGAVDAAACGEGIRRQITTAIPELLANAGIDRGQLRGIGVGFGGPTDDATQSVIKSHHIAGWDGFPLAAWLTDLAGLPIVICNDADVAGLAEARFGAGKGLSPIFYITVGTGIGGGLIIGGEIYRGVGKGASEIGHFVVNYRDENDGHCDGILEQFSAGWGIASRARAYLHSDHRGRRSSLQRLPHDQITTLQVGAAAKAGDEYAKWIMEVAVNSLAEAIRQMITLLCPRRIVIGGGVSLIGEELFFAPLRRRVAEGAFEAFAGLTDIVPAALGEEVVVHGALALARQKLGG
ncbi:MAG TPA: ROK family protein [Gemmataceae bacterium]|nr:ROK family protein [Gemmataceae bacterium]